MFGVGYLTSVDKTKKIRINNGKAEGIFTSDTIKHKTYRVQ
jgi:hypothetical protein